MRLGRLLWPHILATGEVSVGPDGKWKHLTFDELVSLPEETDEGSGTAIKDISVRLKDKQRKQQTQPNAENTPIRKKLPPIRPRLFVTEVTVWKTLTGHGIDFKRVPLMEWRLVVHIGSMKEEGIVQPDLVKATGQDKRSVPRRTDFLNNKGYIVKRTHMIRGMKTSKLWLTRFAPKLPAPTNAMKGLDMSQAILTRDMEPVPWYKQWVGNKNAKGKEELAYHSLVQTVLALVKAWGTLRVSDLKKKLGINGLKWQMKITSKFCRRANERGNLAYTAAQFPGDRNIFKDCIQFVRDPTDNDWRALLATGVRHRPQLGMQSNQKDRRKLMKLHKKKKGKGKARIAVKTQIRALKKRLRLPPSPMAARWKPDKPFANQLAEYVLTGGQQGYTTTEVSMALVGTEFGRYLHKHMANTCKPNTQPAGLSEYQMTSELTRSGKIQSYVFRCAGFPPPAETASTDLAIDPALAQQPIGDEHTTIYDLADLGFQDIDPEEFADDESMPMASVWKLKPSKRAKPKKSYKPRKVRLAEPDADGVDPTNMHDGAPTEGQNTGASSADVPVVDAPPPAPVRKVRRRKAARGVSYVDSLDAVINSDGEIVEPPNATEKPGYKALLDEAGESSAESLVSLNHVKRVEREATIESEKTPDRTLPGVYVGKPGSLNPIPQKKGRPRKSIVMIFRSDKLKDPNFLPGWSDYPKPPDPSELVARKPKPKPRRRAPKLPAPSEAGTPDPAQPEEETEGAEPVQPADASQVEAREVQVDEGVASSSTAKPASQGAVIEPRFALVTFDEDPVAASSSTPVETAADTAATTVPRGQKQKNEKRQVIEPDESGKYICEKCNGVWANDNGLLYHLTKGRNLCNPYYANAPEKLDRSRRRTVASSESAVPDSSASSFAGSVISEISLEPEPRLSLSPEGPRPKEKKRKRPAPKVSRATFAYQPAEVAGPAKPRPIIKQRSVPKNGGVGGNGIVPRGVKASEAVAKRMAEAHKNEKSQDMAATHADQMDVDGAAQSQDYWEPNEEPTYLKHMRANKTKPDDISPHSSQQSREHQAFEVQYAGAAFGDDASPPRFPDSPGVPGVSDYPAELLDPALRTATFGGDVDPAPSATKPARVRKALPRGRLTSSAKPAATKTVRAAKQGGSIQRLPVTQGGSIQRLPPSIRLPSSIWPDRKGMTSSQEKTAIPDRLGEIIQYLLVANGGAFPRDRRTLHWAALKVYRATFPNSTMLPTDRGTSRAVATLRDRGIIKEGGISIQPGGLWKTFRIVYFPEFKIKEDPVVSHLQARAQAVYPEMYIPAPFAPTQDEKIFFSSLERPVKTPDPKARDRGHGRRDHKLVPGIATLNAPFYKASGLAGVRKKRVDLESASEEEARPKRKRKSKNDLAIKRKRKDGDDGERPVKRRRGRKRRDPESEYVVLEPCKLSIGGNGPVNPGISSLPASFFTHISPSVLQFLAPNSQLEDDYVPSTSSDPSVQEEEVEVSDSEPMLPPGTTAETTELHQTSKGAWPQVTLKWFEKHSDSFTMKGWLPTQTERLIANLPKTSEDMGFKITSHCRTELWADPAYGTFLTRIDGCKSWELSDQGKHLMSGVVAPNYVFMNFSSTNEVSSMKPLDLTWREQDEWTLETIPYADLEDNDDDPYLQYEEPPKKRRRGPNSTQPDNGKRLYKKRSLKDPAVVEHKLQRELVSYPVLEDQYFRTSGDNSLGVDWKAEDTRIAAYVAVSTLTGGINKAMDWGLMLRLFPEAKMSNLRKFWSLIKKEREGFINNLTERFQEEFLGAYEDGVLEPFDFNNPLKYNWLKLVKWTLALVVREGIDLPPNRVTFDKELELVLADKHDFDWREFYHHWQRSVFNKFQDATSQPAAIAIDLQPEAIDNESLIARSWVRALCCTDPGQYDAITIRDKFKTLVSRGNRTQQEVGELLVATIADLEHRRVAIKAKAKALSPARPYKLNDHFQSTLDRFANEFKFSVAADFKLEMDREFRKGNAVDLPWRTEDGHIMAAFNLQAAGRVHLIPHPDSKLDIPFGFRPGFYESRKFPKTHYRFHLQVVPTARYLYNEDIETLHIATASDNIPAATADGKLPMWCDFFGTPDRARWFKMLASVLFAYATRGAMTDELATQALKPCFEQFEIEVVREWGLKNGVLHELTGPGSACNVTEWWWLVLGQPLLDMAPPPEKRGGRRTRDQYQDLTTGRSRRRGNYRVI